MPERDRSCTPHSAEESSRRGRQRTTPTGFLITIIQHFILRVLKDLTMSVPCCGWIEIKAVKKHIAVIFSAFVQLPGFFHQQVQNLFPPAANCIAESIHPLRSISKRQLRPDLKGLICPFQGHLGLIYPGSAENGTDLSVFRAGYCYIFAVTAYKLTVNIMFKGFQYFCLLYQYSFDAPGSF